MSARRRGRAGPALGYGLALALLLSLASAGAARSDAWRLTLLAPRHLVAGGADGVLEAQVRDGAGRPAPDGTVVTFTASLGVVPDPVQAATTAGVARTRLVPGTEAGFARLDAQLAGAHVDGLLWVRPGPAQRVIGLWAVPAVLEPGGRAVVTGQVVDAFGNLVEGDPFTWSADGGSVAVGGGRVAHGAVRADFVAGETPGPATLRLLLGEVRGAVGLTVLPPGPRAAPGPVWLPLALSGQPRAGGCDEALANGSFEALAAYGAGQPFAPWTAETGDGRVDVIDGDGQSDGAADGSRWARLATGDGDRAPLLRQSVSVADGASSGVLWLWARAAPGSAPAALRLALWSTVPVGDGTVLAPVLVRRLAVSPDGWEQLALPLPAAPRGATRVDLSAVAEEATDPVALDVDGVSLQVCD